MHNDLKQIRISSIREISAVYFALLQCGYDYYTPERSDAHIRLMHRFSNQLQVPEFFHGIKQDTCQVYPYWPRAAILETAVFFLRPDLTGFTDFHQFKRKIMSASNIQNEERDHRLWDWIANFPSAVNTVISSEQFQSYYTWEQEWIAEENDRCRKMLDEAGPHLDLCINKYDSPVRTIEIVINPIKCVYAADYHTVENKLIFTSGAFRLDSMIHELLHTAVHPAIERFRDRILEQQPHLPDIDPSYYLSGSETGVLNAWEDYAVRQLTSHILRNESPENIPAFLQDLLSAK